ncbi:MAG: diguanylate cyclase [Syntrophomonadaceae bacterium]
MDRILIVDDVPVNIKLLGELLRDQYEIFVANNGTKAVQLAAEIKPDLILMDVMMPDMDGFTACRLLKGGRQTADIPLIFITARNQSDDIVNGFDAGGQDYIAKPFNPHELYARVRSHIELKKSREALAEYAARLERNNNELNILLEKLEVMASIDPLTGIFNRREAVNRMNEEISRYKRNNKEFCILMVDIDNFKNVNDTYGHEIGDCVIKHVVEVTRTHLRQHDMVSRWGGEEFLILLPETNALGAHSAAEKIRSCIEESSVEVRDISISVTVTIGGTEFNPDIDLDANINQADQALYEGKNKSKNCVVMSI